MILRGISLIFSYADRANTALFFLAALILIFSCSRHAVRINDDPERYETKWFTLIDYSEYGMPVFAGPLTVSEINSRTNAVAAVYDRAQKTPVKAYHIAVVPASKKPDPKKPFSVIYEWTGRGFRVGYEYSKDIIEQSAALAGDARGGGGANNDACLALIAAPGSAAGAIIFLGSGIGGFVVGLAESVPATYRELEKTVPGKEQVIMGWTALEYDGRGRMTGYTEYSPPQRSEKLSQTVFFYRKEEPFPFKVTNYSWPEKKERTVYHRKPR